MTLNDMGQRETSKTTDLANSTLEFVPQCRFRLVGRCKMHVGRSVVLFSQSESHQYDPTLGVSL